MPVVCRLSIIGCCVLFGVMAVVLVVGCCVLFVVCVVSCVLCVILRGSLSCQSCVASR